MIDTAMAEMMMSGLSSWRNGCASAASMSSSVMPLALASTSARSCSVTISWSRSAGDSSRSPMKATTNTTSPAMPLMWYSQVQNRGDGRTAHHRDDQAAEHRAAGPEAHGRGPAHLRGEIPDQRGGGHQADALDEADHEPRDGERPLVGHGREDEGHEHPGEQEP